MVDVKRYNVATCVPTNGIAPYGWMLPDVHGDYVKHDDYAAEVSRLRAQLEALSIQAQKARDTAREAQEAAGESYLTTAIDKIGDVIGLVKWIDGRARAALAGEQNTQEKQS
jgi:hypothetical protein